MPSESYKRRLIDEVGLRRIAQGLILAIFALPVVIWIVADIYIAARGVGLTPPFDTALFGALKSPFTTDFASLGFVAAVVIPAAVGIVCYRFIAGANGTASTNTDSLNVTGYIVVLLCLLGVAVSFITMTVITANTQFVDDMSSGGHVAIHALATSTFTFYALYLVQFLGFSPK